MNVMVYNIIQLQKLISISYAILETNKGVTFTDGQQWKADAELLGQKITCHALTCFYLCDGTKPEIDGITRPINFIDFMSIDSMVRSALESYLTFFHIFVDTSIKEDERFFRYNLWRAASLSQRQRLSPLGQASKATLESEKIELAKSLEEIKQSPFFTGDSVSGKARNRIQNNKFFDWKPNRGWFGIASNASMSERFFDDVYNNLSSISHSDAVILGHLQTDDHQGVQHHMAGIAVLFLSMILSLFVLDYVDLFPKGKEKLEGKGDLKAILLINKHIAAAYPTEVEQLLPSDAAES